MQLLTGKRPYLIAEIAQAHDGSLGILHSYIDALAETGVHAVKFQTHIAEAESSPQEPFRVNFSYEDATRYDYWERMEFTREQWRGIRDHCGEVGVDFISSPFSLRAVDLLDDLDVAAFKVGSGEVTNLLLLDRLAQTRRPVILSSGMSSFDELERALTHLRAHGGEVAVLQCTTAYPTPPERVGLNVLGQLRDRFPGMPVGLSEHTAEVATGLAATTLGADILEFHAVFDRRMFGPDASSSLTIDEIARLAREATLIRRMLDHPADKDDVRDFDALRTMFGKSLAVNRALPAGHALTAGDLESKKPGGEGIGAHDYRRVIGRELARPLSAQSFVTEADLKPGA